MKYRITYELIDGEWICNAPVTLARLKADKKRYRTYEIETFSEKVSEDLREYIWSTCIYYCWWVLHTGDPTLDSYQVYEMLLSAVGNDPKLRREMYAPNGDVVGAKIYRLSEMDNDMASHFAMRIRMWGSQVLGITIPEPTRSRAEQGQALEELKAQFPIRKKAA